MQRARTKLPVLFIALTVIGSCALRFFQLLKFTDSSTGLVENKSELSFAVYGLMGLSLIFSLLYGKTVKDRHSIFNIENSGKTVYVSALVLAVAFFADFIHQCYNCYSYIESVSYVEYTYVIPLIISSVLAVISSFYFIVFYLSSKNTNYDFRNFTVFHFAPPAWAFTRLCVIMSKLVDPLDGIETCIEFLVLVLAICFMFSFVSTVDKKDAQVTCFFTFSCVSLFSFGAVLAVPRILMLISGNVKLLSKSDFSVSTYLMLGVLAFAVIRDISKKNTKETY